MRGCHNIEGLFIFLQNVSFVRGQNSDGMSTYQGYETYFLSVLQSVMFNSMPVDMMETNGNKTEKQKKNSISSDAKLHEGQIRQRIEMLLKYLRKYGVPEKHLFEVHELQEMSNIPKVTRCIAMLGKMVRKHTV